MSDSLISNKILMQNFNKRKDLIDKRVFEMKKFNTLKQKVSGPFPQRMSVNSKEKFEVSTKYSSASKSSKNSIMSQLERKRHNDYFIKMPAISVSVQTDHHYLYNRNNYIWSFTIFCSHETEQKVSFKIIKNQNHAIICSEYSRMLTSVGRVAVR